MRNELRATYENRSGRTYARSVYETGSLRLRHPRGAALEALVVNTGGGIVAGDASSIVIDLMDSADVSISGVAAEKIYRSEGATATIATRLRIGARARLAWVPQETILFDRARLERHFAVDVAADASFVACEIVQFGRPAFGELATHGSLRESWRIRRAGALIHADETRIDGAIGAVLDRPATAGGGRAVAQFLYVAPLIEGCGNRLEGVIAPFRSRAGLEGGVSAKDGIVLARLLGRSATDLRPCVAALVEACPKFLLPRSWR